MKEFFAFAERQDFQDFVKITMENPAVQGITIDVDRNWLQLAKLRDLLPPRLFDRWENRIWDWLEYHGWPGVLWSSEGLRRFSDLLPNGPLDWNWFPHWWEDYCKYLGRPAGKNPILVRVCMLPWQPGQQSVPSEGWEFPVVVEHRPQARLCSTKRKTLPLVGGLSIGVQHRSSGTLGGIIEDQNGSRFGITCAHLASQGDSIDQPAQSDRSSTQPIGSVYADSGLIVSSVNTPCSPQNPASKLNTVDAALIELDSSVPADLKILNLGNLTRVYPEMDLNPGDDLFFVGKESGPAQRHLVVGGLNVVFRFSDDGVDFYSFKNTFQVEWPSTISTPPGPPVVAGDSGAWLCKPENHSHAWAGMVIGCHRDMGYALFSETVFNWANAKLKHTPAKVR